MGEGLAYLAKGAPHVRRQGSCELAIVDGVQGAYWQGSWKLDMKLSGEVGTRQ